MVGIGANVAQMSDVACSPTSIALLVLEVWVACVVVWLGRVGGGRRGDGRLRVQHDAHVNHTRTHVALRPRNVVHVTRCNQKVSESACMT